MIWILALIDLAAIYSLGYVVNNYAERWRVFLIILSGIVAVLLGWTAKQRWDRGKR